MVDNKDADIISQNSVLKKLWNQIIKKYNITTTRDRRNVIYRHAFSTAARTNSNLSLKSLANILEKNHATVIHAMKNHEMNYIYDDEYRAVYNKLAQLINDQLADFRVYTAQKEVYINNIAEVEKAVIMENNLLKTQVQNLKNDIEIIKELNENKIKSLSKNYKQAIEDKTVVEAKLKDFRRRYML